MEHFGCMLFRRSGETVVGQHIAQVTVRRRKVTAERIGAVKIIEEATGARAAEKFATVMAGGRKGCLIAVGIINHRGDKRRQ